MLELANTIDNPFLASPQQPPQLWYNAAAGHSGGQAQRFNKFGGPLLHFSFPRQSNTNHFRSQTPRYHASHK